MRVPIEITRRWRIPKAEPSEQDVDRFVATKVKPELRDVVASIRALMKKQAPQAKLGISYGIPAWRGKRILAVISPTKRDITFAFSRGADFDDKYGLLQGVGKVSKHVKIANGSEINKAALRYYIKQALQCDKQ
jgi:hypothetical protein